MSPSEYKKLPPISMNPMSPIYRLKDVHMGLWAVLNFCYNHNKIVTEIIIFTYKSNQIS